MIRLISIAAIVAASAGPALADDDNELGAYLYKADCSTLSRDVIVEDLGDLDQEDDASSGWRRLDMPSAAQPNPFWVEDEGIESLRPAEFAQAGYVVAIHADDDKDADVIACGEVTGTVPFTADLAEVNNSGIVGRVSVEAYKDGVRFTTGAFNVDAVN